MDIKKLGSEGAKERDERPVSTPIKRARTRRARTLARIQLQNFPTSRSRSRFFAVVIARGVLALLVLALIVTLFWATLP